MAHNRAHRPHGHGHANAHGRSHRGDGRIAWAVAVSIGLTVMQSVAVILSGSLMLIADALLHLADAGASVAASP